MEKNKNNLINSKNSEKIPAKRGRPKGSGKKGTRPDRSVAMSVQTEPGENSRFLLHDLKLMNLPEVDLNNPSQIQGRIDDYYRICSEDDIKPSVASFALAFGLSRFTLFDLVNGRNKSITNNAAILTIKKAYNAITSYYEHMMNNGKINPVAGIFLLKNNMGYQDTTNYVISANDNKELNLTDITERSGLLEE